MSLTTSTFMHSNRSISCSHNPFRWILCLTTFQPNVRTFDVPSAPLAMLAALLFTLGLSDLVAISQTPSVSLTHFAAQAPVRLMTFFSIALWSFSHSPKWFTYKAGAVKHHAWGEGLNNRVVFAFAFVEMVSWFWVWTTLREERRDFLLKEQAARRKAEDARME